MKSITIRLTEEERIKLKNEADRFGYSMNFYIKKIIENDLGVIHEKIKLQEELKEEYKNLAYQIRKIGGNLNQINKNFYKGESIEIQKIENRLEELWQLIKL